MRKRYTVGYEIITEESAKHGDAESRGVISETNILRDAIDDVMGHNQTILAVEANDAGDPRWVTVYYDMDPYTGDYENRDIYFAYMCRTPSGKNACMSTSSRKRIARLLGARV